MSRFTEEEMNVLGHDDVSIDAEVEAAPGALESAFEDLLWQDFDKGWPAMVATESDEVTLSGLLVAN